MNEAYTPVKRYEKLSNQVADQIINMILSGGLKIGDRLPPERELCITFEVSRTVIREVISILAAKGLVESKGRNGTVVRSLQGEDIASSLGMLITQEGSIASIENLIEVRRSLEVSNARLAAERASSEDIENLKNILQQMKDSLGNPNVFSENDVKFHFAIAKATQNPLLGIILNPLTDLLLEEIRLSASLVEAQEEGYQFHTRILEKVIAHDGSGASREMYKHLCQSQRSIINAIKERNKEMP